MQCIQSVQHIVCTQAVHDYMSKYVQCTVSSVHKSCSSDSPPIFRHQPAVVFLHMTLLMMDSFDEVILSKDQTKDVKQGKLFQKCTYLLYCSALSLGANVNTRRMSKPDMGSLFHIKKSMKYSGHRELLFELSKFFKFNYQN